MATGPLKPCVQWAQHPTHVLVTINVGDCENPDIKVEKQQLLFKGKGGVDKKDYAVDLKFFGEIDPEKSKFAVRPRAIDFALEKVDAGPYWDRLLETKVKQHWLKVDFTRWKEEDESDDESAGGGGGGGGGGGDLEEMMRNMGGLGGMGGAGGMPGMGGMGGMGGPGGMAGMMGGMGGMGGAGGMPDMSAMMGGMGGDRPDLGELDDEGDSDDEDLPDLE